MIEILRRGFPFNARGSARRNTEQPRPHEHLLAIHHVAGGAGKARFVHGVVKRLPIGRVRFSDAHREWIGGIHRDFFFGVGFCFCDGFFGGLSIRFFICRNVCFGFGCCLFCDCLFLGGRCFFRSGIRRRLCSRLVRQASPTGCERKCKD